MEVDRADVATLRAALRVYLDEGMGDTLNRPATSMP